MKALSFVNGKWVTPNHDPVQVYSPYTHEVIGEQWFATASDVEDALASAYAAKKDMANIPAYERAKILRRAAELLDKEKERLAKLISLELGKPLKNTRDEVSRSVATLELSSDEAKRLIGETLLGDAAERGKEAIAVTFRVPVGVVAAITPFNAPLNLVCHKIGPAFAAGNSIILKPAPQTPLIATELLKILLEAGFPPNAINTVYGGSGSRAANCQRWSCQCDFLYGRGIGKQEYM